MGIKSRPHSSLFSLALLILLLGSPMSPTQAPSRPACCLRGSFTSFGMTDILSWLVLCGRNQPFLCTMSDRPTLSSPTSPMPVEPPSCDNMSPDIYRIAPSKNLESNTLEKDRQDHASEGTEVTEPQLGPGLSCRGPALCCSGFSVAATEYPNKSNTGKKGFILIDGSRKLEATIEGNAWQKEGKA